MKTRSILCGCAAALIVSSAAVIPASAQTTLTLPIRIEGVDSNIYYETVTVSDDDGKITAADALIFADKQSDKLDIKGAETGYITEINGEKAGAFGGYDGWYFAVNNESPSVGISDYTLTEGDELTVYYGGFPCQIPFAETDKLQSDGVITFKSNDTEYDENWNATQKVNPVVDASVTVSGEKFTTDKNGEIKLEPEKLTGDLSVQIEKKDETGAPCVLRFAPDYVITVTKPDTDTQSDTDTSAGDTDTETDTDKNSDSDKGSDTDKSSDSDKESTESSSKPSSSVNTATTGTRTSTSAAVQASVNSTQAAPAQTGDGRTYKALAVFCGTALLALLLVVLGKVTKTKE